MLPLSEDRVNVFSFLQLGVTKNPSKNIQNVHSNTRNGGMSEDKLRNLEFKEVHGGELLGYS